MTFRPQWLSEGYEDLLAALEQRAREPVDFDVVIVGSGYGGAVAAARLAGARKADGSLLSVCVLERGREYVPGTFPRRFCELPGHVRFSRGDQAGAKGSRDGLFDFRIGSDVSALVGSGLGGGSLINAGVAERAHEDVFDDRAWPASLRRDREGREGWYARAEAMLEVQRVPADHFAKYRAFAALGARLGLPPARPAVVARRFADHANGEHAGQAGPEAERNGQGVWQRPCLECGDCVSGCNVWAKNTLPMNYLARARRAGATLCTDVTVERVSRDADAGHWRVAFRATAERHPPEGGRELRAAHVILAAGTFGSTEILMRSRSSTLRFSSRLGTRFSANGDMISVLYGQREPVDAAPEESTALGDRHVGPTITGVIETPGKRAERVLIEELAIPGALRRVFEEVITTGAVPVQLARYDLCRHGPKGPDPAAVDPEKVRRSQVFAAMGDDGAAGRLAMAEGWEQVAGDGAIRVEWPEAGKAEVFERQDRLLAKAQKWWRRGLYLRNPLWMPLPGKLMAMFSGKKPEGKLFTVHPLGGCPMGDDAESGVVDDLGRVFDPERPAERARTHDGLLVLDGSIVPVALGVNPLLTIAALAERAVAGYAALRDWTLDSRPADRLPDLPPLPPGIRRPGDARPREKRPAPQPERVTALRLAETMWKKFEFVDARGKKKRAKLVLDVVFDDIDVVRFLRAAPHEVEIESARLRLLEEGRETASAALGGQVTWMKRGKTRFLSRTLAVFFTWLRLRLLADLFQLRREQGLKGVLTALRNGGGAFAVCSNAGELRYLHYDLTLKEDFRTDAGVLAEGTRIDGLKTFRYAGGGNPWRQLSELTVKVLPGGGGILGVDKLEVDFGEFFRRFAVQLQITAQRDQPGALMDLASLALFMARVVFKVHFWSFRLPEYEKYDRDRARRRLPQALERLEMRREAVRVAGKEGPLVLPLTRYRKDEAKDKPPVLLIHGFGASGAQFAAVRLERNLVRYLAEHGFDVWVAELRTSIAVPESLDQWTLDEVACEDIPAIVRRVLKLTGKDQLDVVAHCIGSAMFCTAVLAGRLREQDPDRDLVRRAVLLQVGPLVTLTPENKARGYAAAAMRRYMLTDHVDSSVDEHADWLNALIDRVLATYPYPESEERWHRLCPPWKRHTHLANCNRSAAVFGRLFQHANLDEAMLDSLGDLLGHTNLKTFEQTVHYAFLERLTDANACNAYVTDENVRKYFNFPVRFLHGEKNEVFHPDTTKRSRKLFKDVFGPRHAASRGVLRGYGHLDPLIGRDAHVDVYPCIAKFLRPAAAAAAIKAPAPRRYPRRPLIGPILGWTRWWNGRPMARIWFRSHDTESWGNFLVAVVLDANGQPIPGCTHLAPLRNRDDDIRNRGGDIHGTLDLLGVVDVPLPDAEQDYEIVIVSAHSSAEAHDGAEAAALPESAAWLDSSELANSQALPGEERDAYGRAVLAHRAGWLGAMRAGERAARTCDPGYDERPDSVCLKRSLLRQLGRDEGRIEFAVASCRYPASRVDREQADAMFGRLREAIERPAGAPSLLLLVGDQIYADATAGMFDPKNRRERFYDSYRETWTAPHAREVLRRIPTYMMLDDHEAGNDWHRGDPDPNADPATGAARMRHWGLTAFEEYQLAHSPNNPDLVVPLSRRPYHYDFDSGGFGFFVCDTRSERRGRSSIMSLAQLSALTQWLDAQKARDDESAAARPKFVVSPSVLVPFLAETAGNARYAGRSDGWEGFPDSLRALFAHIARRRIRNVVFLCGDAHLSMTSRIRFDGPRLEGVSALCVVASPLYAPYPFANRKPADFLDAGRLPLDPLLPGAEMRYEVIDREYFEGDSFTTLAVARDGPGWRVGVTVHRREGERPPITVNLA